MAFLQGISNQYLEQKVFLFLNQSINLQNSTVLIVLMLSCLQTGEMPFHSLHCRLGEVPSNGALRLYSVHEDVSKGLPRQPFKTGKIIKWVQKPGTRRTFQKQVSCFPCSGHQGQNTM